MCVIARSRILELQFVTLNLLSFCFKKSIAFFLKFPSCVEAVYKNEGFVKSNSFIFVFKKFAFENWLFPEKSLIDVLMNLTFVG